MSDVLFNSIPWSVVRGGCLF